uniref:Retrotransposon Copia-like N-terminal domain-containing protein n=1 Tax=Solanum lycopersicum TaxID=4081 RepID=A0A3Q7GTS7_SOLLC
MAIEDDSLGGSSSRTQGETATGNVVMIDHNHPLYLSSSDVPGALSVGIQLTGMENYTIWSRATEIALLGRNKIGFIDGSVLRTDFEDNLKKVWDRCNAIVISWLTCNVSKELLSGILYSPSAHQEALDHIGKNAMHSRLHDDKVHMDRTIQGQEDIPNQLGKLIQKATPTQLQQMLGILQGNKEFLNPQGCVNLAGNPNYCLKWIIDTGASDHMISNDHKMILETKGILKDSFKIKDLGELRYFLGIEFARNSTGILMHQRKYCLELISDMGLSSSKPVGAPIELNKRLTTTEFDLYFFPADKHDKLLKDPGVYQKLIGRLLYPTITRPDIAFSVQLLSQFMHNPKTSHMDAAMRVVRYIKQSPGLGIFMTSEVDNQLKAYCDAD